MSRTLANRSSAFFLDGFYSSLSMMGRALPWSTPSPLWSRGHEECLIRPTRSRKPPRHLATQGH